MKRRALQIFFFAAMAALLPAAGLRATLSSGATYSISFVDIKGDKLSTADGHVTILVLTTAADWEKARTAGDRVPDYCLGNPNYRMITVIHFTGRHRVIGRKIATMVIRHRANQEANRLQARYDAMKISRDAHADMFVVTDFDGTVSLQLGEPSGAMDFCVFVFGRTGELLAQWRGVPSAKQLAEVLKS
ncbi:MAG: hypothetical protein DME76_07155 [Verrucomicrobia bacterium]|nr:MAG: hypothetical protein DME76_07155 [Verrucomicrobiota bacterium]